MSTNSNPNKTKKKKSQGISFLPFIIFVSIFAIIISYANFGQNKSIVTLNYDEFLKRIEINQVKNADISDFKVIGTLVDGKGYEVTINPDLISIVTTKLTDKVITTQILPPKNTDVWGYVINIGGTILIIVFFWIILSKTMQSQGGGQIFNFGKSTAKMFVSDGPKVSFVNVAGLHEAKQEMLEIVDFLREPKKFAAMGAKVPKGVLLVGPPGCGKTLMAKAISGEAKVPFFSVSGSEFVEMFVGVGASRVRDLFLQAKKFAPALIFIDEIDAVGRQRGTGMGGGHDEREQTLNQLLVEMDGYDPHLGIIIIAATNRPDILDPALLRAGRFDRQIMVDMPNSKERDEILKLHAINKPISEAVNLSIIARRTSGFTGADLENLLNEAAILATRRSTVSIGMSEIEEAIDRVIAGPEKKTRVVSEKEKKSIALHEAGHAALIRFFPDQEPVHKISIISRGMALGYTLQLPTDDKYLRSKTELIHMITALLGGRAAEEIMIGDISTGAENDLIHATKIATDMVCKYGMSEKLGPRTFGKDHGPIFLGRDLVQEKDFSDETGRTIDLEVKKLVEDAYVEAKKVILEKKDLLLEMSEALIKVERLEGDELEFFLEKVRPLSEDEKKRTTSI